MATTSFTIKNSSPTINAWADTISNGSGTYTVNVYLNGVSGSSSFGYKIYCKMGWTDSDSDIARTDENAIKNDTTARWSDGAYSKTFYNVPYGEVIGFRTGNTSSSAGAFNRNIGLNYDRDPAPTNVSINPVASGRTSVNLNRQWNNATYCQYNVNDWGWINENSSYPNGVHVNGNNVTNLSANTTYSFRVRFGNGNSDLTYSDTKSCTTTGDIPTITSIITSPTRTSCSFTLNVTYDNAQFSSREIQYGTTTSYGNSTTGTSIGNLNPNTTYYYRAKVTDSFNRTSDWKTGSFTTTGNAPVINEVTTTLTPFTCTFSADVTYDTNDSFGWMYLEYGTTSSYGSHSQTWTIDNLTPETTYYYKLTISSQKERQAIATGTFTTPADQAQAQLKINGTWVKGKVFVKKNGEWIKTKKIFYKKDGGWVATKNS